MSDLGSHLNDRPFWALKLAAPRTIEAFGPPPHPEIAPASMHAVYEYGPRGDMPAAIESLQRCVELDDVPGAHRLLGGLAYADDRLDDARVEFEIAFRGFRDAGGLRRAARVATVLGELHDGSLGNPAAGRGWIERARGLLDRQNLGGRARGMIRRRLDAGRNAAGGDALLFDRRGNAGGGLGQLPDGVGDRGDFIDRFSGGVLDSADLGAAKSDYAKAVSDVERATAALKLARELLEAKAIAQKEVREAQNDERKAVAERERAAARLRTLGVPEQGLPDIAARADASTRVVVGAPRSGVIVERNVSPGQVVSFGQSDTPVSLFVIADLSTMWVVADIYEPDVPKVRNGQSASVRLPCCPNESYEGKVTYVSDSVDKESRTVKVRVVVPNRGRLLKNEMFVKVAIATATARVLDREGQRAEIAGERQARPPIAPLGAGLDGTYRIPGIQPR